MADETASETARREPILERMRRAGGELADTDGSTVVSSFGDPEEEYRALAGSAAVVDDTDRTLIRVSDGRKEGRAHETLSGLLTNHFGAVSSDEAVYTFLLTARGGPVAEMRAIRREKEDWLDLPAVCRDGVLRHFEKYLPPLFARYEVDTSLGRMGVVGPGSAEALGAVAPAVDVGSLEPLHGDTGRVAGAESLVLRREAAEGPGFDLYVPVEEAPGVWHALAEAVGDIGGRPAGLRAREIRRVELGIPVYGRDIDEGTLPHETGQTDRAVSFEKGCYTGQEVVVRIEHRGQVNRLLRGLELGGGGGREGEGEDDPPESGASLYRDGRERGSLTTAVRSPRFGSIALGYVRREVEPGSLLSLEPDGEPACRVRELPFDEPGGAGR